MANQYYRRLMTGERGIDSAINKVLFMTYSKLAWAAFIL